MIRCRRRKISRETRCGANEQRCAAATQKREKARGPKPSHGSAFAKTDMARQPGVCPKRHARLSAIEMKHPKRQKVAKMGDRSGGNARFWGSPIDSVMFAGGRVSRRLRPLYQAICRAQSPERFETGPKIRSNFRSTSIVLWWNTPRDLFAISRRGLLTAALKSVNCDFPLWRRSQTRSKTRCRDLSN